MVVLAANDLVHSFFFVEIDIFNYFQTFFFLLRSLKITNLNTQNVPPSFDEFSYMMSKYKFDIVALSETWLENNKTQLKYVQIDGYKSEFKNRESKCGGGLGLYIK